MGLDRRAVAGTKSHGQCCSSAAAPSSQHSRYFKFKIHFIRDSGESITQ